MVYMKHGIQMDYYSKRRHYKDGELNGLFEEWYNNGQLRIRQKIEYNGLDGLSELWNEDGKLVRKETYKDGELQKSDIIY